MISIHPVRDETFALSTPDGFKIYGLYNKSPNPNGKLLIIAHGLTGHTREYLHQMAARHFTGAGYDVVRMEFYGDEPGARRLYEANLKLHVQDLKQVLAHFRGDYKKVFIAGHSYGGMTSMLLNPEVDAISMWDSSLYPYKEWWAWSTRYAPEHNCYLMYTGTESIISAQMVEEGSSWDWDKTSAAARAMKAPVQLMIAGLHVERPGQMKLFNEFPEPKDVRTFQAGHDFFENDTVFDLLQQTQAWFDRF